MSGNPITEALERIAVVNARNLEERLMAAPDIAERVLDIIAETLDIPIHDIAKSDSLFDDLDMDSLDVADLVAQLETAFEIEISYNEFDNVRTVQDVIDTVQRYRR